MTGPSKNHQQDNEPGPDLHRDIMQSIREHRAQRQLARMPGNGNTRPPTATMDRQKILYALGLCSNTEAANEAYAAFRRLWPPQKG